MQVLYLVHLDYNMRIHYIVHIHIYLYKRVVTCGIPMEKFEKKYFILHDV